MGAKRRAIAKRRKKRIKKIGELIPPEEKINRRTVEISTTVSMKIGLILRKNNLETK